MPIRMLALVALAWVAGAGAATPVEPYGRMPAIEDAALSPDGTRIAFVHTTEDQRSIAVVQLDPNKVVAILHIGDRKLRSLTWADETHLLLTTATTGMPWGLVGEDAEWLRMTVYDLDTHKARPLLDRVGDDVRTMNAVYGRPIVRHSDKGTLLYLHGLYVSDTTCAALFRVNLQSGAERLFRQGGPSTQRWLIDDTGEVAAEQSYVESGQRWEIRVFHGGHPAETASGTAPIDAAHMLGLTADGTSIIVALVEDDHVVWKTLARRDASWGPDVAADRTLTGLVLADGSDRMLAMANEGDETAYFFASPEVQANWDWVSRVLHHERVELVSVSANARRILVRALGPRSGYAYYLADLDQHVVHNLGDVYRDLGPIAAVRKITYAAADGLQIPAYLTLPPGRPEKGLPLVMMPHGGPEASDQLGFDYWAQAFAARGYAVLQPNYRGSDLGHGWVERGFGEFGRRMQTDLSDGVHALVAQGLVDPQRVCIVGSSYGGYAALAGVTLQTGIYRCAVSLAGISDPAEMLRHVRSAESYGQKTGLRYWQRFMGVDGPADAHIGEISPIRHVDRLAAPVLLLHGKEDTVVPYDQSADMAKAMKRAGKAYEMVTLDREDHYLSRGATRLQALRAMVGFVEKYSPPE
jgi:dipeptidyl aminopeptidase/acylaminoacyl peptidase